MKCPCCGGDMPAVIPTTALSAITMPDSERAILDLAVAAYPRPVTATALANGVWGHRPDGGPLDTKNGLGVRVHHLNRRIRPLGWRIKAENLGFGYGRRLVKVESADAR